MKFEAQIKETNNLLFVYFFTGMVFIFYIFILILVKVVVILRLIIC